MDFEFEDTHSVTSKLSLKKILQQQHIATAQIITIITRSYIYQTTKERASLVDLKFRSRWTNDLDPEIQKSINNISSKITLKSI